MLTVLCLNVLTNKRAQSSPRITVLRSQTYILEKKISKPFYFQSVYNLKRLLTKSILQQIFKESGFNSFSNNSMFVYMCATRNK